MNNFINLIKENLVTILFFDLIIVIFLYEKISLSTAIVGVMILIANRYMIYKNNHKGGGKIEKNCI